MNVSGTKEEQVQNEFPGWQPISEADYGSCFCAAKCHRDETGTWLEVRLCALETRLIDRDGRPFEADLFRPA